MMTMNDHQNRHSNQNNHQNSSNQCATNTNFTSNIDNRISSNDKMVADNTLINYVTNEPSLSSPPSSIPLTNGNHHHHHYLFEHLSIVSNQNYQQLTSDEQQSWLLRRRGHNTNRQQQQQHQQQQQNQFNSKESSTSKRSHEEDVYEDLCYVTLRANLNRQSSENHQQHQSLMVNNNNMIISKREYCLKELIETEKNYCEALKMIINNFYQPLMNVLTIKHRNVIFSNLQSICELHLQLYGELYRCNSNGPCSSNHHSPINHHQYPQQQHTISSCFLSLHEQFLIYGEYCANLPKAHQLLDELCGQDPVIEHWVTRCQEQANQGRFKLRDLLSLPMQRILKYHLLLAELIRNTSEHHDDYFGLKRAHDMMIDIGAYINEMKRDTETLDIINEIQRSIIDLSMPDDYELKDYGRLIKDGEVRMRGPSVSYQDINDNFININTNHGNRMTTRLKNRYIFIFDKVMLMCKTIRSLQYSYKEAIILEEYRLEDMSICSPISKLTKNWSSGWSLVHCRTKQSYTFYVKNEEIKRKWMEAIERAQDNVRPKQLSQTDHHLALATIETKTCASCHKLLIGTWFQGYQCYVCNVAVHKSCISTVRSCALIMHEKQQQQQQQQQQSSSSIDTKIERNRNCEPPTPSRNKQRILAKAIIANNVPGQLMMELNDTIVVFSNNGPTSYGLNLRLGEEGSFPSVCVTELMADSPSNASSSNIDSPTCSSVFRFCYDDQSINNNNNQHSNDNQSPTTQTLPRKLHQSNWIMPTSPLAVSTPALNKENVFFSNDDRATTTNPSSASTSMNPALIQDGNLKLYFGNGYNLEEYAWFAGSMDRDTAQTTLNPLPNGSFLVRISPKQRNNYAISINYKGQVKHMRVQVSYMNGIQPTRMFDANDQRNNLKQPDKPTHFYLSERRYFRTIVDLVRWYESNSLAESFNMVNTQLLLPYKKAYCHEVLGDAIALYAFTGTSSAASSFLSLRKGDRITVLSRAAEDKGWWKGQIDDRLGYFPFKYVSPTTYTLKRCVDQQRTANNQQYQQQQQSSPSYDHHQQDDSFGAMTTSTQITNISSSTSSSAQLSPTTTITAAAAAAVTNVNDKSMPSSSCSILSSSSSSTSDTSSPMTLSSPVNSDRDSPPTSTTSSSSSTNMIIHSRQASSDAGIIGDIGDHLSSMTINNDVDGCDGDGGGDEDDDGKNLMAN